MEGCDNDSGIHGKVDLSPVSNADLLAGLAIPGPKALHGCHNIHAVFHLTEGHMPAPQPLSLDSADEKLGTVCVRSSICHGQDARTCMFQDEVLILKFLPVDGLAACAMMACEVTSLAHKSRNNSVKAGALITKSFLPSAQSTEVFCRLWNFVCKQLEGDTAQGLAVVDGEVEVHGGAPHGWSQAASGRRRLQSLERQF
ncbi:hypothetical protein D623_10022347 [Myotis brandtii]|uniref:Uncharacterized protein n=1 Tax=Myotis brandtii TaxID=109478 RepID=S7N135_MYOBR|nr:hypothetical protein D623_10022347 [Myotis brandtii]